MEKHFSKYFKKHPVLSKQAMVNGDVKVVIPVFLEEEYLFTTINSLKNAAKECKAVIELILVFNYAANADGVTIARQLKLTKEVEEAKVDTETDHFKITILKAFEITPKHAGVGYARKVGMDYASKAFADYNCGDGLIASLDADCLVALNYFTALLDVFKRMKLNGCTIYFEHPLKGEYHATIYEAIAEYELHLRYYIQALRFAGFPYAYHTVGSCFAITANAYVKAGGMPRKQAGEDFYFLQKVIPQGAFKAISNTTVQPSSRPSDRVPFGTGPSINKLVESGDEYLTYNLQAFIDLKAFFSIKEKLYKIDPVDIEDCLTDLSGRMRSYLLNSDFFDALKPINDNCNSLQVFNKRFYEVFNAFRVVKYLNYTHTHFIEKTPVFEAALQLLEVLQGEEPDVLDTSELLLLYRKIEKENLTF